ncbi:Mobile element protein [Mariniradius saccharolyticus AK6]|uniref:Mobile element protein n=2 Tax=Mariniradius TaxID=1245590 RepID=M7XQS7_9BACT|nr:MULTISPECIES: IS3 family transposase [Mariniradius]EMS30882.1 Mobile element protein [Mariniradius saccharolyticus AK6]MCF1753387.1 IS3 family transposase [Mariniradius sediminis]
MKWVYLVSGATRQAHHQSAARQVRQLEKEVVYVRLMEQTREIHPGMGLRTMYELLEPEGIGRDAFVALGLREGFRLKAVERHTRTTFSVKSNRYRNLLGGIWFTGVNQLWVSDITYVYCLGRFYYLVMVMDAYSRRILGYSLADNMRAENNLNALRMALETRGISDYGGGLIHHSDKGGQYVSDIYTDTLDAYGIRISMCDEVYENTHIERVNDTIKNQYLNRIHIASQRELMQKVAQVINTYNNKRPHQAIGKTTPSEYENLLKEIPIEKRTKMEIYTQERAERLDPNQLKIQFN